MIDVLLFVYLGGKIIITTIAYSGDSFQEECRTCQRFFPKYRNNPISNNSVVFYALFANRKLLTEKEVSILEIFNTRFKKKDEEIRLTRGQRKIHATLSVKDREDYEQLKYEFFKAMDKVQANEEEYIEKIKELETSLEERDKDNDKLKEKNELLTTNLDRLTYKIITSSPSTSGLQ